MTLGVEYTVICDAGHDEDCRKQETFNSVEETLISDNWSVSSLGRHICSGCAELTTRDGTPMREANS